MKGAGFLPLILTVGLLQVLVVNWQVAFGKKGLSLTSIEYRNGLFGRLPSAGNSMTLRLVHLTDALRLRSMATCSWQRTDDGKLLAVPSITS